MPPLAADARTNPAPRAATAVQVLVFLAAAGVALNALGNGFPNDDQWIVAEARDFRHPSQWGHALVRPWWPYANALWRPVTTLQLAFETWLGGGQPWLYHAVNPLWHGLAALLVTRLALRWAPPVAAGVAGLWFAWWPIHVEPIATLVGRADLGVTVFLLLAALLATRDGPLARSRGWALAACAALAMGSKESGIAAPAVVWAFARMRHGHAAALSRAGWAAAGLVPLLIGRYLVLGTLGGDEPHPTWVGLAPGPAIALALRSLAVGVSYLAWPRRPVFEHAPPQALIDAPEPWLVATGGALAVTAITAGLWHLARPRPATAAIVWWAATLLPVSNLVFRSGIVLADRTLYGPSVGAALLVASGLAWGLTRRGGPIVAATVAAALALVALPRTWRDLPAWKDSQTFIEQIIARAPDAWPGYLFRGMARAGSGDRAGAIADYERGIALFGREQRLLTERARFALQDADTTRAIDHLERALAAHPKALRPRQVLLDVYAKRGVADRRCALLREGVRLAPDQRRWAAEWAGMQAAGRCR